MFQSGVGFSTIEIGLENEIVGDDIGGNTSLSDETVEGEEVGVLGLAKEGVEDGVDGEDGGAAIGVDGVSREERGLVEVVLADQLENAVVEIEAVAGEGRDGLGEFWGVGVLRDLRILGFGGLLLLGAVEGGERGFDAQAALAAAAFGGGFFRGGEGEGAAEGDEGGGCWWWVVVRLG